MTVLLNPHPSADQLRAFGLGQLTPEDADAIERHVTTCDSCCHRLESATDNSFEHRLRQAHQEAVSPGIPPELAEHPRYRVLALVGQGGMGAVYRAEHRHMQRPVALKVLKPQLIRSPGMVRRFHQEVRAAARLHHPNIVTAHDADEARGLHFLVMEYVEGRSLAELVRAGPLPVAEACALVRQAALGLQHAHEQGMVHRDIKPHNLMVTPAGQVKILDFGLARLAEGPEEASSPAATGAAPLTGAGAVMGTADYIAPEQAADPRSADIRADIYSLGCTLYHLLTGQPPFPDGTDQDKISRHTHESVPALTGVPAALAAVVARMTARDPVQRYRTPAEVAEALTPFTRSSAKDTRGRKRRPWLVALLLLVAGLLSGGIALRVHTDRGDIVVETDDNSLELTVRRNGQIIRIRDPHSGQTWDVDTRQYQLAVADQEDGLVIELPGRGTLTLRRRGGGTVTVTTAPAKGKKPASVRLPEPAELAKRPNGADALKRADIPREALAYLGDGDPAQAPPELVAVLGDVRLRCPGGAGQPALSPDGKIVVVPGGEKMYVFDTNTGNRVRSFAVGEGSPLDLKIALAPDSHTLAVAGNDGDCELWDAASGKRIHTLSLKDRLIDPGTPVFSSDGKLVAALSHHAKRVGVWEVGSGRLVLEWKGPPNPPGHSIDIVRDVSFSGDGRTVAIACIDDDVRFFERIPKGRFEESPADKRPVKSGSRIALSPDGRALAVYDSKSRQIRLCNADGRTRFKIESILCGLLAFSSDSKILIAACWAVRDGDWSISRFDVATGKNLTDPEPVQIDQDAHWSFSADGKTVALVVRDERVVRLLDVETGKQRLPGPELPWLGSDLAFSPDGRSLVTRNSGPLQVWDLSNGRVAATWGTSSGSPMVFSPDGTILAMVYLGKEVELYRFPEGKRLCTCRGPEKGIGVIALSPDGKRVAAGGSDQSIWVWRSRDGKMERVLHTEAQTEALTFSPDGRFLCATTQGDHEPYEALRIWNLQAGAEQKEPRVVEEKAAILAFLPDGKTLIGMDRDGRVWLRDGITGALKKAFAAPELVVNDKLKGIGWRSQALSPGGHLAAVGTDTGPLVVWQPGSSPLRQRQLHLFPPGKHHVRALAFSPDGRYLAATHPDGIVCIFRLAEQGKLPDLLPPKQQSTAAPVLLPDAAELAKRPNDADALKREDIPREALAYLSDGDPAKVPPELVAVIGDVRLRCPGGAGQPVLSPDGQLVVVPGGEKLYVFDASTGSRVRSFAVCKGSPLHLKMTIGPDSRTLAVTGNEGDCELWDVSSGKRIHTLSLKDRLKGPEAPVFSPDGNLVAVGSYYAKRVGVWEIGSGRLALEWKGPPNPKGYFDEIVRDVSFGDDGRTMAVACIDNDLRFFERAPKGQYQEVPADKQPVKSGSRIALSPDGRALAFYNREDRAIRLCSATGKTRFKIPCSLCGVLTFTPDSNVLLAARFAVGDRGDWSISRFDVATGKNLTDPEPVQIDQAARWSLRADGRIAAVVLRDERVVRLLDVETGKQRLPGPGLTRPGKDLSFSPDGRYLVSANNGPLQVLDLSKGRVATRWEIEWGFPMVFNADGTRLARAPLHTEVELYRFPEGKRQCTCRGPEKGIGVIALSPDGKRVAAGGPDHSIWVWRSRDGKMERVLHTEAKTEALTFSPDGRFLCAITHGDQEPYTALRIWSLEPGTEQKEPRVVKADAAILTYLPDGKTLAGMDREGHVWLRDGITGALKKTFAVPERAAYDPSGDHYERGQALSPGAYLAAVSTKQGPIVVWQPGSRPLRERHLSFFLPGDYHAHRLAFSPDGRYLVAPHADGLILLFRLAERGQLPDLLPPKVQSTAVPLPDPAELAKLLNAADALKREDVSREALDFLRDTGLKKVPPELVAVLGDMRLRCPGRAGPPTFSPDGKLVIVPGVLVFDAATGIRQRGILPECGSEQKVVLSPDQRTLAVAQNGHDHFELWDFRTGKRLHRLPVQDSTWEPDAPVFSLDGKYVAVSSLHCKRARVWEVGSGRLALAWNGPPNLADEEAQHVANVAFSADSRTLAVACTDDNLHFFELTAKGQFQKVPPDRCLLPSGGRIAFSPDGRTLAVHNARDRKIRLCDARGKPRSAIECGLCEHFVFTSDSKTLVLVDYDRVFSRFDVATGKILKAVKPLQIRLHVGWAVSPDGKTVAVVERYGRVVHLFDVATGKQRLPAPGPDFLGLSLAFSPDGRYLISGNSGPVQVWDLATTKVASTWDSFAIGPILFSRDGKIMTLRSQDVEWWRFPEGKKLGSFYPGPEDPIWSMALSGDGKRLAAGGKDDFVRLWNTAEGKKERVLNHGAETQALTFSPNGRFLLAATCGQSNEGGKLKIWDLKSATELASVEAWAQALAFLPDGKTVVGLSEMGQVWLRDGFTGALKQEFPAPALLARDPEKGLGSKPLALSPGGRLAAVASNSGPLVVWQPGTKPLRQLHLQLFEPDPYNRVRAVAFSPDGRYLAATHPDGIICLFRLAERGQLPELPSQNK